MSEDRLSEKARQLTELAEHRRWAWAFEPWWSLPEDQHCTAYHNALNDLGGWLGSGAVTVDEFVSGRRRVVRVRTLVPTTAAERRRMLADLCRFHLTVDLLPVAKLEPMYQDMLKGKPL